MGSAESKNGPNKLDMPAMDSRACSLGCVIPSLTPLGFGVGSANVSDAPKRQILLIRHGHKLDSDFGWTKFFEETTHQMDTPLSPAGQSMARELGAKFTELAASGLKVDQILVSPYLRCLQTAQPVAQAVDCKMRTEPGLVEMPAGSIMGKPEWDDHEAMLLRQSTRQHMFPLVMDEDHPPLYTPELQADRQPDGEHTPEQFVTRMIDFVHAWLTSTNGANETHVFVSHNLTLAVIISLLCGCELKKSMFMAGMMKVASVTRLVEKANGEWVVDTAMGGNISHMSSENTSVANGQDFDKTHDFYKKVTEWAFYGIDGDPENSVLGCVTGYAKGGAMPKRMLERRSQLFSLQ